MQRNNQPMASPDCMGCKATFFLSESARTIQITISASRNKPSGNSCGKIALSSPSEGRFQKPVENLRENDKINGDSRTAGTMAPTSPAISFGEASRSEEHTSELQSLRHL